MSLKRTYPFLIALMVALFAWILSWHIWLWLSLLFTVYGIWNLLETKKQNSSKVSGYFLKAIIFISVVAAGLAIFFFIAASNYQF